MLDSKESMGEVDLKVQKVHLFTPSMPHNPDNGDFHRFKSLKSSDSERLLPEHASSSATFVQHSSSNAKQRLFSAEKCF